MQNGKQCGVGRGHSTHISTQLAAAGGSKGAESVGVGASVAHVQCLSNRLHTGGERGDRRGQPGTRLSQATQQPGAPAAGLRTARPRLQQRQAPARGPAWALLLGPAPQLARAPVRGRHRLGLGKGQSDPPQVQGLAPAAARPGGWKALAKALARAKARARAAPLLAEAVLVAGRRRWRGEAGRRPRGRG